MKKINYFDTPQERRTKGNSLVNIISYVLGFKKVIKHIKKYEKSKRHIQV